MPITEPKETSAPSSARGSIRRKLAASQSDPAKYAGTAAVNPPPAEDAGTSNPKEKSNGDSTD
jgi:hypothetical protein